MNEKAMYGLTSVVVVIAVFMTVRMVKLQRELGRLKTTFAEASAKTDRQNSSGANRRQYDVGRGRASAVYNDFRFYRAGEHAIQLSSVSGLPMDVPIAMRGGSDLKRLKVPSQMTATVPPDFPDTGAFYVYIVANFPPSDPMEVDSTAKLVIVPVTKKVFEATDAKYASEELWFGVIQNKEVRRFIDFGFGNCRYFQHDHKTDQGELVLASVVRPPTSGVKGSVEVPVPEDFKLWIPPRALQFDVDGVVRFGVEQEKTTRVDLVSYKGGVVWARTFAIKKMRSGQMVPFHATVMNNAAKPELALSFYDIPQKTLIDTKVTLEVTGWKLYRRYE